jgi:hypothetical protein
MQSIDSSTVCLAEYNFRSNIAGRACQPLSRHLARPHSESEVCQFEVDVVHTACEQDVLWFDVSVYNLQVVAVLDRLEQNCECIPCLSLVIYCFLQ